MKNTIRPTPPGADTFLGLGFSPSDAKKLAAIATFEPRAVKALKVRLSEVLAEWINDHNLTHEQAGIVLQVSRPRVSDVVNFKVDKFSIDALVNMAELVGIATELSFETTG